ncbi:MAG: trypsin-like peptidase domain-containing protein [Defluviitaleaceae bacterium]|nr:trypsin-like peptidase domain-containing protein [Defluviitaleaceae bacterium]
MDEYGKIPDEINDPPEYQPPQPEYQPPTPISYRKAGPTPEASYGFSTSKPTSTYAPGMSLHEEAFRETQENQRENRKFYGFVTLILILSIIGAPLLGAGFGLSTRFFDNYFLPILLDDTAERENFSFDNINASISTSQGPASHLSYVELFQLVEPSVVLITANMPSASRGVFDFNFGPASSAGSGILIYETSTRYYIATNAHVIEGAQQVHVSIAGSPKIPAMPVGRDDDADLAVIAVNKAAAIQQGVTYVRLASFGDSSLMLEGQGVLAIGNSMGEGNTVTNGIIGAINREIFVQNRHLPEVIQTNAAINQGNSGGPLINLYGQVIGINTAKFSERLAEGMGYAIPSNVAMPILERIMHESATTAATGRPMIGITFTGLSEGLAAHLRSAYIYNDIDEDDLIVPNEGLLVRSIISGSPADTAGLQIDDIITAVDGNAVSADHEIIDIFSAMQVGDEVALSIVRNGTESLVITVTLGPSITSF